MEQTTIKERTREGIAIAKSQGKYTGRKIGAIALNSHDSIERLDFPNPNLPENLMSLVRQFIIGSEF